MNDDNHLHLEVRDILQHIKNAIGNETLWIKHYENLIKIEKDLPESVKQAVSGENVEIPDSLDKLKISHFLKLERSLYDITDTASLGVLNDTISKIEQIFIPDVFNFKERLKLTLCAVSHMNNGNTKTNYESILQIFKSLDSIIINSKPTTDPVQDNGKINDLEGAKKKIEDKMKKYEGKLSRYRKRYGELTETITSQIKTRSQSAGDGNDGNSKPPTIEINSIFDEKKFIQIEHNSLTPDPITALKEAYNKLPDTEKNKKNHTKEDKEQIWDKMFQCFDWISFAAIARRDQKNEDKTKVINIIKKKFIEYVEQELLKLKLKDEEKLRNDLLEKIKNLQIGEFSKYLKNYYFYGKSGLVVRDDAKLLVVETKEDFFKLYNDTPIYLLVGDNHTSQQAFDNYIRELFDNLYNELLKKSQISSFIDEEIKTLKKELQHDKRKQNNLIYDFNTENKPLLRNFLYFVDDCINFMSQEIKSHHNDEREYWYNLEKTIGNEISLDDETLKREIDGDQISLFDYLEKQLNKSKEKKEEEEETSLLIVKAKLIYLLQNYHYF